MISAEITFAAMTAVPEAATEVAILGALSGHLCRCSGYQGMCRDSRRLAVEQLAASVGEVA